LTLSASCWWVLHCDRSCPEHRSHWPKRGWLLKHAALCFIRLPE
jgi:hypothetical protein